MRQTGTSIDNASEHMLNDHWNDDRKVSLSEEWMGTTRLQILRIKLREGYNWVNGRPTKVQKTTRPDTISARGMAQRRRKDQIARRSQEKEGCSTVHSKKQNS